jgi:hypothetical protein
MSERMKLADEECKILYLLAMRSCKVKGRYFPKNLWINTFCFASAETDYKLNRVITQIDCFICNQSIVEDYNDVYTGVYYHGMKHLNENGLAGFI